SSPHRERQVFGVEVIALFIVPILEQLIRPPIRSARGSRPFAFVAALSGGRSLLASQMSQLFLRFPVVGEPLRVELAGVQSFEHRASGFAVVPAVPETTTRRDLLDVGEGLLP